MLRFAQLALACLTVMVSAQQFSPQNIARSYNLATSTTFPFPASTESSENTQALILSEWSLGKGRIQENPNNLEFVADPYPTSNATSKAPVLRVTYPEGSYTHASGGGTQFYNLWNTTDGSTFGTMLLSYELAFEKGFDWVKGGKLPGLRGGLNSTGCSGGKLPNGVDCFSTRLMWRKLGNGEVYAYIPTSNDICTRADVSCNDDFGMSLNRGSFTFTIGEWQRISMLVQMNHPANTANGNIQLYVNNNLVLSQEGLQIRTADSLSINGLFFSTFFGGADSSYATPHTTHTYYRDIQLWGSSRTSNLTGPVIKSGGFSSYPGTSIALPLVLSLFALVIL